MTEKEIFKETFVHFQNKYKGLEIRGTMVYYKGKCRFNVDGYNLLYNLTRLCNVLEDELL